MVLAPGLGFAAPQYAGLAEDLASRGYVVVGVTPTGSANVTVLNGRAVGPTAEGNPPDFTGDQSAHDRAVAERLLAVWTQDLLFAADTAAPLPGSARLAGHLAPRRGRRTSGTPSAAPLPWPPATPTAMPRRRGPRRRALRTGRRRRADGAGPARPARRLLHRRRLQRRPARTTGRTSPPPGRFLAASTGPTRRATVPGSGHLDFSDDGLYYWALPLRRLLGLGDAGGRQVLRQTADLVAGTLTR